MALIDKASLLMVPSVYEDGTLYNVLPSGNKAPDETGNHNGYDQTRADFTFSRGFNLAATRVNADGLIEKGRENLLLQSNNFSNASWIQTDITPTSGELGYDGSNDAWLLSATASNGNLVQNVSHSGVNTLSFYAKQGSLQYVYILFNGGGFNGTAGIDLTDGAIYNTSAYIVDIKTTDVGGGWYRIEAVSNRTNSDIRIYPSNNNSGGTTAVGNIYIQNAQLEVGLVATDYIETGATTATAGVLENTPRIDYSSGAGALLLEPQRTNLITNSEYLEDSSWSKATGGTGSNPVLDFGYTSPEGVDNAYKVTFDKGAGTTTSDLSVLQTSFTSASNTASFYVKADAATRLMVRNSGTWAIYDITTEWTRIEKTDTGGSLQIGLREGYGLSDVPNSCSVYLYGVQVESGATYGSSYVPTYGSAATRGADSCSVTGASDVIPNEGVFYIDMSIEDFENYTSFFQLSEGTNTSIRFWAATYSGSTGLFGQIYVQGVDVKRQLLTETKNERIKAAIRYDSGDIAFYVNGSQLYKGTETFTPEALTIIDNFKLFGNSEVKSGGSVYGLGVFPVLSDSELATLTTL